MHYIRERINDLRNYRAHIELFADRLPAGTDPARELQRVNYQIIELTRELHALPMPKMHAAA